MGVATKKKPGTGKTPGRYVAYETMAVQSLGLEAVLEVHRCMLLRPTPHSPDTGRHTRVLVH